MSIRELATAVGAVLLTAALTAPVHGAVSSGKGKQVTLKSAHVPSGKVPSGKVPSGAVPAGKVAIAPIQSHPHGKTYSQWSAEWWQWALEAPTPVNPVLDLTGANCAEGQRGHVWFLAGSFGSDPVERECTIRTGTALFFPIVNTFYGAEKADPPETKTEVFCRAQVAPILTDTTSLTLTVDGRAAKDLFSYRERSVLFVVQLPEDNIFGIDDADPSERLVDPACDAGFYVFLAPLPPGAHTLHWTAAGFNEQDITYHLTVAPGR